MENLENAQAERTTRRHYEGKSQGVKERVGGIQGTSGLVGNGEVGNITQSNSGKGYAGIYACESGSTIGKILERLELIERQHLADVRARKGKLEALVNQISEEDETFRQSLDQLRQEIYTLSTTDEDPGNETEHISEPN